MDKVVKFPKESSDECTCDLCQVTEEFLEYIAFTETNEQLKEVLGDLIQEGFELGYRKAIMDDLDSKLELLNHIENDFDEQQ